MKLDLEKSPMNYFADTKGEIVPIFLNGGEMKVIQLIRKLEYGELTIIVKKGKVSSVKPIFKLEDNEEIADYFNDKNPLEVIVFLNWTEINVVKIVRELNYGEVFVNIAKRIIMKIQPLHSYPPTLMVASELVAQEELKYNNNKYGSKNT